MARSKQSPLKRFFKLVLEIGECWLWLGALDRDGYGVYTPEGKATARAHKWIWEQMVGDVLFEHELDHTCRNRSCVNPAHLQEVTHRINVERGLCGVLHTPKSHCNYGHSLGGDNLYVSPNGNRHCRQCKKDIRLINSLFDYLGRKPGKVAA